MAASKTLDAIAVGDHACVVTDSDEHHREVISRYVADGLRRREKVIYFDGTRSTDPLLRRLHEDNIDPASHLRTGQLVLIPPEDTAQLWKLTVDQLADQVGRTVDDALAEGWSAVRVTDEPIDGLARPAGIPLRAYDRAVNERITGRPVTVLCQYQRACYPPAELAELRAEHRLEVLAPSIYDDGLLRIVREGPFRTRASGEIDVTNRYQVRHIIEQELELALRTAGHADEIELHLESVRFADVAAVTQFVQAAEAFPQSHKLILYGVRHSIRRVLDRCGGRFTNQLAVRDRPDPVADRNPE